jgi:hypothetical protein
LQNPSFDAFVLDSGAEKAIILLVIVPRFYKYLVSVPALEVEISPVFPTDIDIAKNIMVKLTHKETVDSVEQKNAT